MAKANVTALARKVHVSRWVVDQPPPAHQQEIGRIDYWNEYEFVVPGILLMQEWIFPTGVASKCAGKGPRTEGAVSASFTMQAVTPISDTETRYFFAWGPRRIEDTDGKLAEAFRDVAVKAFEEDRKMIEAQQSNIGLTNDRQMMVIGADKGLIFFRKMMEQLARDELPSQIKAVR
jgi:vanillate O-demethylase monooxygenase subunit